MIEKIKINTKRLIYRIRRDYLTLNNVVFAVGLIIALNWTWNSIGVMQQNYELQQAVDGKKQQVVLEKLRVENLQLEGKYYDSLEYQELAVRERLGKGMPGEKMLITASTDRPTETIEGATPKPPKKSNFQDWMNFLFTRKPNNLQN